MFKMTHELKRAIDDLDISANNVATQLVSLSAQPLDRFRGPVLGQYDSAHRILKELLPMVDNLLSQYAKEVTTGEMAVPTHETIDPLIAALVSDDMYLKAAPMAAYSGCFAWRRTSFAFGLFICVRESAESWNLMLWVSKANEDECLAVDLRNSGDALKMVCLKKKDWTPLSTIFPDKPSKRWEHAAGTTVLALWFEKGECTNEFAKATVLQSPYERTDGLRAYKLRFQGGQELDVLEKFVVTIPDGWKDDDDT
jgi:hypothetical protein